MPIRGRLALRLASTLAGVFALALAGCSHQAQTVSAAQPKPKTVLAQFGTLSPVTRLSGVIAPLQNVGLSSSLQEPADGVYVNEGQYVRAGETLAHLNVDDIQANLEAADRSADEAQAKVTQTGYQGRLAIVQGTSGFSQSRADLQQAQQKLALDTLTLQRDQALFGKGYVAQQDLDTARTQVETDQASVRSARAALVNAAVTVRVNGNGDEGLQASNTVSSQAAAASARAQADQYRVQISRATIASPVDGIVVNRNLNPGEYPGQRQIFTIQEIDTVYAMLSASADEILNMRPGGRALVHVGGLRPMTFNGVVEAVLGQAQPGSTNFTVKVRVPNVGRVLQSGMVVSADVQMPPARGTIVPTSAFTDGSHGAVRVADPNGSIRVVAVQDVAGDGSRSIVQGLRPGTHVVIGNE